MAGETNTNAAGPTLIKVAFYTIGDDKVVHDSQGTGSDWFQTRAGTLASDPVYVFGKRTIDEATTALKGLSASVKINRLYFCGHGNLSGFILNEANWEFLVDPASQDPKVSAHGSRDSGDFLTELATHLASGFQIWFLGCRMGNILVPAWGKALSGKGVSGSIKGYLSYCTMGLQSTLDDKRWHAANPNDHSRDNDPPKDYDASGQEFTETINGKTWEHNQVPEADKTATVTP